MRGQKSHLEYALLGLLAARPAHGYELFKRIKDLPALEGIWFVKQANLYALLEKLESRGLIASREVEAGGYPPRREYALTSAGAQTLQVWLSEPVARPREMRQEFLLRLYFARQSGAQAAQELLANQRQALLHWQAEIEQARTGLPPGETFQAIVLEYRLRQSQATLDWLEWCAGQPYLQG